MALIRGEVAQAVGSNHLWAATEKRSREQLWVRRKSLRDKAKRYTKWAESVRSSHAHFAAKRCPKTGSVWLIPTSTSGLRLDPFEMRQRAKRAQKRFADLIRSLSHSKFLTLHEPNCADLEAGMKSLWAAWKTLWPWLMQEYGARGAIAVLEITYNQERGDWHPHLHVVLDCPGFIPRERLNEAWQSMSRGLFVDIRKIDEAAVKELCKYVCKPVEFVHIPEAVEAFLEATRRRRFVRTYGSLYGQKFEDEPRSLFEEGVFCLHCGRKSREQARCSHCGSLRVREYRHCPECRTVHAVEQVGWLDFRNVRLDEDGVYRPCSADALRTPT